MTINASHTDLVLLPLISATIIAVAGVITPLVRRQPQQLSTHSANQGQILCTITLKKCHVRIRKYLYSLKRLHASSKKENQAMLSAVWSINTAQELIFCRKDLGIWIRKLVEKITLSYSTTCPLSAAVAAALGARSWVPLLLWSQDDQQILQKSSSLST